VLAGDGAIVQATKASIASHRHPWTSLPQIGDLNSDSTLTPRTPRSGSQPVAPHRATPATMERVDVSGDDKVTSPGALMILHAAAGAISLRGLSQQQGQRSMFVRLVASLAIGADITVSVHSISSIIFASLSHETPCFASLQTLILSRSAQRCS